MLLYPAIPIYAHRSDMQMQSWVLRNASTRSQLVQNQAQGPVDQNQGQVPAGQIPVQGPVQVIQNVPVQPLQQLVPNATGSCWYCSACF